MRLNNGEVLFAWPLAEHTITAGWYYSDGSLHRAIDLRAAVGTPVYAAEDGTVDWVQAWDGHSTRGDQSYGNLVRIRHADYNGGKLQTLYAHLQRVTVKNGQAVREGEVIGYSGNTGNSTGPHLHFEVRLSGTRCNPLNWLDDDFSVARSAVRLGSYTSVKRPATTLVAGSELHLQRVPLYVSSTAVSAAGTASGTYYVWSAEPADGRVRITNAADRVGQAGQVTGWISVSDAGVQTQPVKKLFISQPMRGKTDTEILRERKKLIVDATVALGEDEIQVLDTVFTDFADDTPPLVYLGRSLEVLARADAAIFAPGWETARGCRIEHNAAEAYGVPIVEL